ncbi:hypothetical protein J5N97_006177 [Dioscorea zingiberensis]|uniref:Uncharacterized protein n=1 Tax=Dioscorea zingiberensis TaxID=325984 RepID=A0A9D5D9U0_9LILI|nr:hypothetical protein J5N97_006177 [Dioscorea zingiberensis]
MAELDLRKPELGGLFAGTMSSPPWISFAFGKPRLISLTKGLVFVWCWSPRGHRLRRSSLDGSDLVLFVSLWKPAKRKSSGSHFFTPISRSNPLINSPFLKISQEL